MPFIQKVKVTNAGLSECYRNYSSLFFNYIPQCLINDCLYSTQSSDKVLHGYVKTAHSQSFALAEGFGRTEGERKEWNEKPQG